MRAASLIVMFLLTLLPHQIYTFILGLRQVYTGFTPGLHEVKVTFGTEFKQDLHHI